MNGLKFLAIANSNDHLVIERIANEIVKIVTEKYAEYSLYITNPCLIGVVDTTSKDMSIQNTIDYISNMFEIIKNRNLNSIIFSSEEIHWHINMKKMLMRLRKDVNDNFNNFRIVVQPIVSAKTHKIVGGEALLRWQYQGRNISPMIFIPELEANGLIVPVGRWVFEKAATICKQALLYNPNFFLDFNVSYYQTNDDSLPKFMAEVLSKLDLDGRHLVMELTETHYNDNPLKLKKLTDECNKIQLKMALDDFGVGYSSLEMLFKYPADIIKLDKNILQKMTDTKENSKFIASIIYSCHTIGKTVCAEGVETEDELSIVSKAGTDLIQGFYFYKPLEIQEFYDELKKTILKK